MKLEITFTDGTTDTAEITDWGDFDDLLAGGFSGPWLRLTGDDLARWYRVDTIRSIEAFS